MKKLQCANCGSKMPENHFQTFYAQGQIITDWCPICVMTAENLIHGQEMGDDSMIGERGRKLIEDSWEYYHPNTDDPYGFLGIRKNENPIFSPYFGVNKDS